MSVNIYNSNPNATSEEENFSCVADRGSKLASDTIYSNTTSGLNSVNVQGAIDEVNEKVEDNIEAISQINSDLSSSYQTIYDDSGRFIKLYRYGKLRMLFIQDVMATTSVHSLIPASDMPLGGKIRGTLVCSHDSSFTIGDLFIDSSHTYWLADTGEVSSSSYIFYGQIMWVVS